MTTKTPLGAWLDEEIAITTVNLKDLGMSDDEIERCLKPYFALRAFDEGHVFITENCCGGCGNDYPCPSRVKIMKAVGL